MSLRLVLNLLLTIAFMTLFAVDGSGATNDVKFTRLKMEALEQQKNGVARTDQAIPAQTLVFTNMPGWLTFWEKHGVSNPPRIDFSTNSVVGVFLGPASPGHAVEITRITYNQAKEIFSVYVTEWQPNPALTYSAVIIYPGDMVLFPKQVGKTEFIVSSKIQPER
jgi:hypothetical protein